MNDTAPIFVTGIPRSGTTFIQHLLSQHPRIQIHGQEPTACSWGTWLKTLSAGVEFSAQSNHELGYQQPHYAAPTDRLEAGRKFLEFMRWYLSGGQESPRWGAKSLSQCQIAAHEIRVIWPGTRWIVCARNPFRSIESLRNTFDPNGSCDPHGICKLWTESVLFADSEDVTLIQIDRLTSHEQRKQAVIELLDHVGEPLACEVRAFIRQWPVIHKVTPDADRQFELSTAEREQLLAGDSEFARCVEKLGYLNAVEAAS